MIGAASTSVNRGRVQRREARIVLLAALLTAASPSAPAAQATLQVIVFPGGFNWPIWAAQEEGCFGREGLEVKLTSTPNSVFELTNLLEGKFDIGHIAIDIRAYRAGGTWPYDRTHRAEARAILQK